MLIRDLFKQQVAKTPDAAAVVFEGKETSWREIDSLSNRLAWALKEFGIEKEDRVAGILANSMEFNVIYLALLKAGIVFVPLNYQSKGSHIEFIVKHSESKLLLCDDQFIPTVKEVLPKLKYVNKVITVGGSPPPEGIISLHDVMAQGKDAEPSVPLKDDDLAVFLYTAGTTGDSKGVVHTQLNVSFASQHWAKVFHMGPGRTILIVLPLFHAFGIHCLAVPALISGARMVIGAKYQTQWAMEAIQNYRVTELIIVPAMGNMILNHPDFPKYDFSSLELLLMGGAIVPYELLKQWRDKFPRLEIINGFGQTESCPCATGLWDVDILTKPGSVGKPWDVVQLKIVNDEGKEVSPRKVGEIAYKVASIMKEYYKDPKLTAETVRDGWLYSGDLGYVDEDGYVYIVDRKKDIIIRGGENISSMEVEEVLHKHPAVLEASAISAPHPILGETVMAVVVRKPGQSLSEEELVRFCEGHLEHFKVPTKVEFMDVLPRNPAGKVLKRELKAKYLAQGKRE
jgi:acyl-CoA synthetase (AMP-forming)/AMP-acid ligase II